MDHDEAWCHDCDEPVELWSDFVRHANEGHAIANGRCPDHCQFCAPCPLT